jgi:hypothetical protein
VVGLSGGQGVGGEAEGAAQGAGSGVAGGEDVDVGVADHDGFGGCDGWGVGVSFAEDGVGFGDEGFEAVGVRLLGVEGVAAVVLEEETVEGEVGADVAGGVDGLVGENGHGEAGVGGTDGLERVDSAGVDVGEVKLVGAVVIEEEGDGVVEVGLLDAVGVAEGATDEHGGSVADVAGDDGVGEGGAVKVGQGGVDGVAEVLAGVDEGSIEVEDEEAGMGKSHDFTIRDVGSDAGLLKLKAFRSVRWRSDPTSF